MSISTMRRKEERQTKKRQKRERRRKERPPNGEKGGSLPPSPVDVGKTFQDDDDSDDDLDDAEVFEDARTGTDDPTKVFDFFVDENDENVAPLIKNDFETKKYHDAGRRQRRQRRRQSRFWRRRAE